jgi:dipeptidyl aminopeptidase/acylaminoacyl peptidase
MSDIPFKQFLEVRRAFAPALSPDGRGLAFVSDLTGYPEAWLYQGRGRRPWQLTEFRERVGRIRWASHGRILVLDTDLGGDECWAIRSLRPDGTGHLTLSGSPEVMHLMGSLSPDGRRLSVSTNAEDPARFAPGIIDVATRELRTLYRDGQSYLPAGFSPDGRFVAALRMHGSFRQDPVLFPVEGGEPIALSPEDGPVRHLDPCFEADGRGLLVLTDRGRDFLGLARIDIASKKLAWRYAPEDRDVDLLAVARKKKVALLAENERGWSRLKALDLGSGETLDIDHPPGCVTEIDITFDGRRGAFALSRPTAPSEVFFADLATGETEQATTSPCGELNCAEFVEPEEVVFRSFDGVTIPGLLSVPPGFSSPRPAVIKVHGGPEAQARPCYDPVVPYLLSRGFAVYEPNVRGSTGYGRRFAALDDGRLRFDAIEDLAKAAEFLKSDGRVDGGRLSLLGGSYGGFMVLAGLAFHPELWSAGVSICGIANFRTFLSNTGPYRREWRAAEYGDPTADADFLDEISPVNHADRIKAPLLVIQGANDPRVPPDESEQIVRAVKEAGGVARQMLFADEGHGIVKLDNRLKAWEAVVDFLEEFGK